MNINGDLINLAVIYWINLAETAYRAAWLRLDICFWLDHAIQFILIFLNWLTGSGWLMQIEAGLKK